ncbi:MAG: CBS domain-containing protein [Methanobacteriota archaeon]|nr:MAG: CBS domain-containing protein [Euryarchaeota archaeon]
MELRDVVNGSRPVRIPPDATAADALVALVENKTDFVMVDRAEAGDAYGIINRRDIVLRPIAEGKPLSTMAALECAHKPVMVMHNLDLDIRWVAKKMANENVSVIMVFEGENFLGSVSDVDILKAIAANDAREGEVGED